VRHAALLLLALVCAPGVAQDKTESRELVGHVGSRDALLVLHAAQRPDSGWQVAGEYLLLPTLTRRFLEGERSPQMGVTTLKEGTSAILFGRPASGELRGTWGGGVFKGTRYGPGGQAREDFEFNEEFPPMEAYTGTARCQASDGRYSSSLAYAVEAGRIKSFEWRSKLAPGGHQCLIVNPAQQPLSGGLKLETGGCTVTLREVGERVKVAAEGCTQVCGSEAYLEPLLVDKRGNCQLLRAEVK
jgi:hypothetical protein